MENKNDETTLNLTPKFENLSEGTLRRYQAFFNLRGVDGDICKDKAKLIELIKEHFNTMVVDDQKVIENTMKIEKDNTNEKNNCIRKSLRFQEKNIAKFLDSFGTK